MFKGSFRNPSPAGASCTLVRSNGGSKKAGLHADPETESGNLKVLWVAGAADKHAHVVG